MPLPDWVAAVVRRHLATYRPRLDERLVANEVGGFVSRGYQRLYILRPALVRAGLMGSVHALDSIAGDKPLWRAAWTDKDGAAHSATFPNEGAAVRAVARLHHPASSSGHGLRHAYVSGLVTSGLDPVHAALAAGHTDPAFTLRTYAHPGSDAMRRIRAAQGEVDVD